MSALPCPYCEHPVTRVVETRAHRGATPTLRRKRKCPECGGISETVEVPYVRLANKLNGNQVRAIRLAHSHGVSITHLAERFKVSRRTIGDIVAGRTWTQPKKSGVPSKKD